MKPLKSLAVFALAAGLFTAGSAASAQVNIGVSIGAAPICPYGYFDYAPYDCAPYGYYGPDWFPNGVFLGAGPWFHGPRGFYGHVDNRYDPHYGYHGPFPERGAQPFNHFHGNEGRDGQGHIGDPRHDAGRSASRVCRADTATLAANAAESEVAVGAKQSTLAGVTSHRAGVRSFASLVPCSLPYPLR